MQRLARCPDRCCTSSGVRAWLRLLPLLCRTFWLLMVAAHTSGLIAAWRSFVSPGAAFGRFGGCIGLTLAMVFFVLKVWDVPFLRFRTDRHTMIALCMIVALLHVDVIRRGSNPIAVPESAVLVATTWLAGALPQLSRCISAALYRVRMALKHRLPVTPWRDAVWVDILRPHCWLLTYRFFILRAPPA